MNKKLGIVSSSGGAVIYEIYPFLQKNDIDLIVATDRECDIEVQCKKHEVTFKRFDYKNKNDFSNSVSEFFCQNEVDSLVFLYYTRFIGNKLFENYKTLNFHPSLLPLFPGLNPMKNQLDNEVSLIGSTVHEVDYSCDGGPIIGQIANSYTKKKAGKISFLQKVFLSLCAVELFVLNKDQKASFKKQFINSNLFLSDEALVFFQLVQSKYQIKIVGLS